MVLGAENVPAAGAILFIANHVSDSDEEILRGAFSRPIYFDAVSERLCRGEAVAIFPEGSPARTGTIESFHTDVESLIASHPDVSVLPVALHRGFSSNNPVIVIGPPIIERLSAAELRRKIVELSCDAVNRGRSPESTLCHRFIQVARQHWDQPALADSSGRSVTYGELLTEALLLKGLLCKALPEEQPHVGIYLPASLSAAIANYAVILAGRTAVNLNFTAGEQNVRAAAAHCDLKTILTSQVFLDKTALPLWKEMMTLESIYAQVNATERKLAMQSARSARVSDLTAEINPDTSACILFSSGSTGAPKGAQLTHWQILANAEGLGAKIPTTSADVVLGVLPFFHSFGYTFALWFPVLEGIRAVYHSNPADAKTIGELAQSHQATFFFSTPTFCTQYMRKIPAVQFSSLKYIIVGAEKLRDSIADEFQSHFGIELLAGYGCTELGPGVAINVPDFLEHSVMHVGNRRGSVGRPLQGVAIRIVDPDSFEPLAIGQQGMVLVNGPSRMVGYWRALELTKQALHDGYYSTGDLGFVDEDGFLFISDRLARFSKVAGEMVPHLALEEAVSAITFSFVTGVPDARRGERLTMLFTNPEVTPADLFQRLRKSNLPALWIPKREDIHYIEAIPTLASGKLNLMLARKLAIEADNSRISAKRPI
jgi:acyl-[acyl-carrier-protein]-phospholipid O-acyltransferase/long-chain-fatty-acid--[acyl-carrier-protein] ligase